MAEQHFKSHSRYVPLHHFIAPTLILVFMIGSVINLVNACNKHDGLHSALLIFLVGPIVLIIWWYSRFFALRAQDRAIRAEENLRYFAITGKLLDSKLTMRQIVALRFASNNEFVSLAQRAVEENLKPADIKKAIQNWKEDHNRV